MHYLYPFIISFMFIFLSELGDKTQILVLSFSAKNKSTNILLGVAIGTLLSHGLAIAFGSQIAIINDDVLIYYLKIFTYFTFFIFGIVGFFKTKTAHSSNKDTEPTSKSRIIQFFSSLTKNSILIVAVSIAIGELGDKTFLSSIGLGVQYPVYKLPLICGSVCGMVASNCIAIFFGKWLGTKISTSTIEYLSNIIFILFGLLGFLQFFEIW